MTLDKHKMLVILVIASLTLYQIHVTGLDCSAWEPSLTEKVLPVLSTCYLVYSKESRLTWEEARRYCETYGGMLAKIKDSRTDMYLSQNLDDGEEFWIGVSRREAEGSSGYEWVYTDKEKVVFSLLTDPPNYMETTVVHVLYMEVWKELETCPWRKADPGEKKRFICQYKYTAPPGITFPPIYPDDESLTTTQETTSTTITTTLPTTIITSMPLTTTARYPATTVLTTTTVQTTTKRQKAAMQKQTSSKRIHRKNVTMPPFQTFDINNTLNCIKKCSQEAECIGISIRKATSTCHIYTDHVAMLSASMGEESGWNTFQVLYNYVA